MNREWDDLRVAGAFLTIFPVARGLEIEGRWLATEALSLQFGLAANRSEFKRFNVSNTLGTAGSDFIDDNGRGWFIMDGRKTAFSPWITGRMESRKSTCRPFTRI